MNQQKHDKSSLFLMEIIINILFFAFLASFCVQIFFKAYEMSKDTSRLHQAVTACTSIVEICRSENWQGADIKKIYTQYEEQEKVILIYFDKDFNACKKPDAMYCASVSWDEDNPEKVNVAMKEQGQNETIYELSASCYQPGVLNLSGED